MSDIEKALAEALEAALGDTYIADGDDVYRPVPVPDAAAILATEPMQTITRQAAIGAAVSEAIAHGAVLKVYRGWSEHAYVAVVMTDHGWDVAEADTLPAAIAAALGDEA
jgi:hypothetical protein